MFRSFLFVFLTLFTIAGYCTDIDKINVFVSVLPQKFLLERIGGEYVSVIVMVKPGHSPETYEPSPKQMASLTQSRLYFRIGVPFENIWIDSIKAVNEQLRIIECCKAIEQFLTTEKEKHIDNERSGYLDPHIWTSPANVRILAKRIKEVLMIEDPAHQRHYYVNYRHLIDELDELDSFIQSKLSDVRTPYIIVAHPSWGHYAERYGLIQVSLEHNGRERGPRGLSELIDLAIEKNIATLFFQQQSKSASTVTFAKEIGAELIEVDPLAENYIENLRMVTRVFAEATR